MIQYANLFYTYLLFFALFLVINSKPFLSDKLLTSIVGSVTCLVESDVTAEMCCLMYGNTEDNIFETTWSISGVLVSNLGRSALIKTSISSGSRIKKSDKYSNVFPTESS